MGAVALYTDNPYAWNLAYTTVLALILVNLVIFVYYVAIPTSWEEFKDNKKWPLLIEVGIAFFLGAFGLFGTTFFLLATTGLKWGVVSISQDKHKKTMEAAARAQP